MLLEEATTFDRGYGGVPMHGSWQLLRKVASAPAFPFVLHNGNFNLSCRSAATFLRFDAADLQLSFCNPTHTLATNSTGILGLQIPSSGLQVARGVLQLET